MTMPTFLIIGAAKSGTSALWKYLPQHPDIYMSPKKEPHFFAYENAVPDANGPRDYTKYAKTNLTAYQALFADVTTEKAIGEAATTSLYIPRAVERIKHYIPQAKFIAMLRQPADRAYSSFMHLIRDRREPVKDFREALKLEHGRIADHWGFMWHYTQMGFYYEQVRRFYDNFNREQVRIYLYDEFNTNPLCIIQDIYRFLEVNDDFIPDMSVRANMSGVQKSKITEGLITAVFDRPNLLRFIFRKLLSEEKRWRFTTSVRNRNLKQKTLSLNLRCELTQLFREDILRLQDLLDRDLSHWLS